MAALRQQQLPVLFAKENVVGTLAVVYGVTNLIDTEELALVGSGSDVAAVMGLTKVAALGLPDVQPVYTSLLRSSGSHELRDEERKMAFRRYLPSACYRLHRSLPSISGWYADHYRSSWNCFCSRSDRSFSIRSYHYMENTGNLYQEFTAEYSLHA